MRVLLLLTMLFFEKNAIAAVVRPVEMTTQLIDNQSVMRSLQWKGNALPDIFPQNRSTFFFEKKKPQRSAAVQKRGNQLGRAALLLGLYCIVNAISVAYGMGGIPLFLLSFLPFIAMGMGIVALFCGTRKFKTTIGGIILGLTSRFFALHNS